MTDIETDLIKWSEAIGDYHIPRWEELPDLELYMDQVITYIEKHLALFSDNSNSNDKRIITPSMVNNYVKHKLIPKPIKRKYNKKHLAYLIVISILKHVFTIQDIKDGITNQVKISGEKEAYNLFCEEQEQSIRYMVKQINSKAEKIDSISINMDNIVVKMATLTFANKIIAEKSIKLQKYVLEGFDNE